MSSAPTPESVIHDIGFRHYDGPRLGRGWAFRSLLLETLRGAYGLGRPPKVKAMPWILVGIMVLVAFILDAVTIVTKASEPILPYSQFAVSMWLVIALFVAGRAPYAISRDMRDGVMSLYLSRPIIRRDYVLAKFAGLAIAVFAFVAGPLLVLLVGSLLAKMPPWHETWTWLGALAMAALLSVLLTAIAMVFAAFTRRRGFGVAAIMAALVLAFPFSNILMEVVAMKGSQASAAYAAILDPFLLVDGLGASWLGATAFAVNSRPEGLVGGTIFTVAFVAIVAACVAILMRRFKKEGGA